MVVQHSVHVNSFLGCGLTALTPVADKRNAAAATAEANDSHSIVCLPNKRFT
jgi:hypothetical protein